MKTSTYHRFFESRKPTLFLGKIKFTAILCLLILCDLSGESITLDSDILKECTVLECSSGDTENHVPIIKTDDDISITAVCYANLNLSLDQFGNATLLPEDVDAGSTSSCGGISLSVSPSTFDCSDVGSTFLVVLTVTDECGGFNQCWSEVLIEDKIGPSIACSSLVYISLGPDGTATITEDHITEGASDNCALLTYELSQSTFDCSDIGESIIVFVTVTDIGGNTSQCWTEIIVEDKIPPVFIWPSDVTIECNGNTDPNFLGEPIITDNCGIFASSYQDQIFNLPGDNVKILREWTVIEWLSGDIYYYIQIIKTIDTQSPVAVCVANINLSLDAAGNATLTPEAIDAGSYDECGDVTLSVSPSTFDCSDVGITYVVLLTVTDESGNTNQCWTNVLIEDKTGPSVVCNSQVNISLGADGTAIITPDIINAGSYDNCDSISYELSQSMFDCSNIGESITVILTVTDASGNTNECWSTIFVEDKLPPIVTCPPDLTLDCSQANNLDPTVTGYPTVVDNCDQIGTSYEDQIFSIGGADQKVLRTWKVIDWYSGSLQECIQVITIFDVSPPDMVCLNALIASLDANGNLTLFPGDFDLATTDDCGDVTLSINQSQFDCSDIGLSSITLTATDENDNVSQCIVSLTIQGLDADGDGYSICNGECNDNDGSISPGSTEVCGDNIDNNCDGEIDEGCICPSYGQSTQMEWIESVDVNGSANITGNDNGYGDYTSITLPMVIGSNTVQLTPGFSGSKQKEFWSIWIDFNQNAQFDANEEVLNENSKNTINSSIQIPLSAIIGTTTMRIAMKYNQYSDPCEIFARGEVEDYTVNITGPQYCISTGQSTQYEWINKVQLMSINNQSGNDNGYGDYTTISTNLNPGQSKNIKLQPGFSGSSYLEYWRVWVDWNDDGDFDDSGELEVETSAIGNITEQISVPNNASSGNKIMRISMKYNGYADACETFGEGEVEDYTIFITGSNPSIEQSESPLSALMVDIVASEATNDIINNRNSNFELEVQLFPNPTSNIINIKLTSELRSEKEIIMYNEIGQVVYRNKTIESEHQINVTPDKYSNGIYLVQIRQGKHVMFKKVIVSK